ncbi:MAG: hypothetical protein JST54_32335 [Deltaproteobacteria bacterium]|nr:hypothetical protein [Deltaproteobacteria bacterium]
MRLPVRTLLRRAFETLLASSATPYGYTVAIWCSGALLMHDRGTPTVGDVYLFLVGGLAAFTAVSLLNQRFRSTRPVSKPIALDWSGMLDWLASGVSVGCAWVVAQIGSWVSWLLAPLVVTAIYLLLSTFQLAVSAANRD